MKEQHPHSVGIAIRGIFWEGNAYKYATAAIERAIQRWAIVNKRNEQLFWDREDTSILWYPLKYLSHIIIMSLDCRLIRCCRSITMDIVSCAALWSTIFLTKIFYCRKLSQQTACQNLNNFITGENDKFNIHSYFIKISIHWVQWWIPHLCLQRDADAIF